MKYFIVALMMTILSLYAVLDHQIKKIDILENETVYLKSDIADRTQIINTLEDWRSEQTPPDALPYTWPIKLSEYKQFTSFYGPRNDPLRANTGGSDIKYHAAVDMTGIEGAQVLSVASGTVLHKYYERGWHNGKWYNGHDIFNGYVVIVHDDGTTAHYGHVSDILVYEGQRVEAGQPIARINPVPDEHSTGPHLDFRLQDASGDYVNPLLWIGKE